MLKSYLAVKNFIRWSDLPKMRGYKSEEKTDLKSVLKLDDRMPFGLILQPHCTTLVHANSHFTALAYVDSLKSIDPDLIILYWDGHVVKQVDKDQLLQFIRIAVQ